MSDRMSIICLLPSFAAWAIPTFVCVAGLFAGCYLGPKVFWSDTADAEKLGLMISGAGLGAFVVAFLASASALTCR